MRRSASEGGWALVSVLWGLVIISLIAAVMLSSARVSYRQAAFSVAQAQRDALTEAATARTVLALLDSRVDHRWRIDGVPQPWVFNGRPMQISVEDEGGKIDLNAAGAPAIQQLLNATGVGGIALADKILDWRDQKGDLHRLNGATGDDYIAAGRDYHPRGGSLQSVDELKLVLGMTTELYDRIRPALTAYSGRSKVNLATAPADVLMAVGGQNQAMAAATIAARQSVSAPEGFQGQPIINGVVASGIPIDGWSFAIHVTIPDEGHIQNRIVRLTPKASTPFVYQEM